MRIYQMLFMALFLAVFVAGCNDNNGPGDTTAPTVSSTNPVDAATSVAPNQKITAIFSEAMANCTTTTFTLVDNTSTAVTGTVTCVGRTAIFTPTTPPLADSTTYTATITTGITDLAGNKLAAAKVWSFTTGTTAANTDNTDPTIISSTPADGDTGVVLNSNINATFSEAIDPATCTTTTFTLHDDTANAAVTGTVTCVDSVATFTPAGNLAASHGFTVTITAGVMDLAGNPFAGGSEVFTTGTTVVANPAAVNLGTAANYTVFANTGIDTTPGASIITGDIGLGPGVTSTAFTGFTPTNVPSTFATFAEVSGKAYAFDYAPPTPTRVNTASLDMGTAYTDAAGRTATSAATTDVGGGTLTDLTLTAGVYEWGSAVTIPTDLTLSGSATDVWIFKVAGTLDMAAAKNVILAGSAQSKNIFWQVSGATTIGANTHFEGTILDMTAITFGANSSINGRLLAQTAANLNATAVAQP